MDPSACKYLPVSRLRSGRPQDDTGWDWAEVHDPSRGWNGLVIPGPVSPTVAGRRELLSTALDRPREGER
jgi:hypothetical protein